MPPTLVGWRDPLDIARLLLERGEKLTLLYSGVRTSYSGRYSYVAWGEDRVCSGNSLSALHEVEQDEKATCLPHWFGTIGYEASEEKPKTSNAETIIPAPSVRFVRYRNVLKCDHETRTISYEGTNIEALLEWWDAIPIADNIPPAVINLTPLMPRVEYLQHVQDALNHIHAGNVYQVNLTRKYHGKFARALTACDAMALFARLCTISPAPYSALLLQGDDAILSSSPELFIALDNEGHITTRPIKGTAPLATSADLLHHSSKDRAENLMIVDLMRNDLSHCAISGSVHVPALYEVDSFTTLRHLSSTIQATLSPDRTLNDLLRATFPAGSMTGAPKRSAMQWIADHEKRHRGIYSGALGWINGRTCELSVVIRTLVARGKECEFQVGGGIVSDSEPQKEYEETLTKAQGMAKMLGITVE
jgi:anthranilate/para-aminobenzoate synthase component I